MFIEKTKSVVDGSDVNNRRFFNKKKSAIKAILDQAENTIWFSL